MNGNDYLVKVKANQKNLLQALKDTVDSSMPVDTFKSEEKNRGRHECREVYVYSPLSNIPVRNIAINIARQNGLDSIKHASIFFSSNVKKLFKAMKT